MKHILTIVLLALIAGCTTKKQKHFAFSGMIDMTDKKLLWPQSRQFQEKLYCDRFPMADFMFRLQAISDKIQNPCIKFHLAGEPTGNILKETVDNRTRSIAIGRYYSAITSAVDSFYHSNDTTIGKQRSICAEPILNELELLAAGNFDKATLAVVSDLREHSTAWNSYEKPVGNKDSIAGWLASLRPGMPSLKNITVFLIFTARTTDEDAAFYTIAQGYKLFLEKKGAQVQIAATL